VPSSAFVATSVEPSTTSRGLTDAGPAGETGLESGKPILLDGLRSSRESGGAVQARQGRAGQVNLNDFYWRIRSKILMAKGSARSPLQTQSLAIFEFQGSHLDAAITLQIFDMKIIEVMRHYY
jgi:hypothetical protein